MNSLGKGERDELATCMAALVLHDAGAELTSEQIQTLLAATGNNEVEAYWPVLFANMLSSNIAELVFKSASAGGAVAAGPAAGAVAGGDGEAAAEEKDEEEEEEEEIDLGGGGMDMFGDEGGDY